MPRTIHPFPRCPKPARESRLSKLVSYYQCVFRRRRRIRKTEQEAIPTVCTLQPSWHFSREILKLLKHFETLLCLAGVPQNMSNRYENVTKINLGVWAWRSQYCFKKLTTTTFISRRKRNRAAHCTWSWIKAIFCEVTRHSVSIFWAFLRHTSNFLYLS